MRGQAVGRCGISLFLWISLPLSFLSLPLTSFSLPFFLPSFPPSPLPFSVFPIPILLFFVSFFTSILLLSLFPLLLHIHPSSFPPFLSLSQHQRICFCSLGPGRFVKSHDSHNLRISEWHITSEPQEALGTENDGIREPESQESWDLRTLGLRNQGSLNLGQ